MSNIDEILKKIESQNISFIQEFYSFCENKKRLMSLSNLIASIFPVKHINNLLVTDILLGLLTLPVLPLVITLVFCCVLLRGIIDVNKSKDIRFQSLLFFLIFFLFGPGIYLLMFGWLLGIAFILWGLFASYYLMSFRLLFIKEWTTHYISRLEYCHKQLFYFFIDSNFELFNVVEHVKLINSAYKGVKNIDRVLSIFNIVLLQNIQNSGENLSGIRVRYLGRIEKPIEEMVRNQLAGHLHKEYTYLHEQLMRISASLQQTMQKHIILLQHRQSIVSNTLSRDETLIRVAQLQNQRLEIQIEQFYLISKKLLQISQSKLPNF